MSTKQTRERFCSLCYTCKNDCKKKSELRECEFYTKGYTRKEYLELIREQNLNIKKLCDKTGIGRNTLFKMLNGKLPLTYKYRYFLDLAIFEKEEWIQYYERFEVVD